MDKEMLLSDHLNELRRRLIIAVLAILAAAAASFFFSDRILQVLLLPSGGLHLQAFSLMDGFMIKTRIALYTGIVVAFPVWAYEIYSFVSPGLTSSERGMTFPLFFGSLGLFTIGTIFGFYLLWGIIKVLIGLFPSEVSLLPTADSYISFVVFFLLACGIAFQLPTALVLLVELHLLSSDLMRRHRKSAYFTLFVFAEIITPVSDPIVAPLTVMIPLVILYELSIYLGKRIENRRSALKPDFQKSL
jgi:sec-independent protein translocase protein TatC